MSFPPELLQALAGGGQPGAPAGQPPPPGTPGTVPSSRVIVPPSQGVPGQSMPSAAPPVSPQIPGQPMMRPAVASPIPGGSGAGDTLFGLSLNPASINGGSSVFGQQPMSGTVPNMDQPIIDAIFSGQSGVEQRRPKKKTRSSNLPKPDFGEVVAVSRKLVEFYRDRNHRMSRDVAIFRQYDSGVPTDYDPDEDTAVISAAMSNLINKLCNMMSGLDPVISAPSRDEITEKHAQSIEDFCYWDVDAVRLQEADSGGGVRRRDEFFYQFLHGFICARVLPDLFDDTYPWIDELLDPSTCYPVYGNPKEGMIQMVRVYNQSAAQIVNTYGPFTPGLQEAIMKRLGEGKDTFRMFQMKELEVIEFWDGKWRGVCLRDGTPLLEMKEHGLRRVPFVMTSAIGEPRSMQTPEGGYAIKDTQLGGYNVAVSLSHDQAQKGVSVFHYLINTHRLKEAVMTLLYANIEKSGEQPVVRYRAPQLMNTDDPEMDWKRKGKNYAVLGMEKIEPLMSSVNPADSGPVLEQIDTDFYSGSINPGAAGMEMGANASGYALETLIAAAKELVLPYLQSYENYLTLKFRLKLEQYEDVIGDLMTLRVPLNMQWGSSNGFTDLTTEAVRVIGTTVKVRMRNISDSTLAERGMTASNLVQAGFWSQKEGMDYVGVRNPAKMLADIMSEQALQHPAMMELFGIPAALIARGADEIADLWMQYVGNTTLMNIQAQNMQLQMASDPMAMAAGGGGASGPPDTGGQSFGPTAAGSPGGPAPGEGRVS